ncbi:MAG TPA: MFS transporter [Pyrinomonadaceae bacterium]|nr:MFS transporter [Pyrinomonadaceae bacterium]
MAPLTYMELLRGNRSFRNLLAGQVVSELGNWFNFIAVLGLVRAVTGAAPEATAVLVVLRFAPFALLAPVAGALADRWSRRAVMIWTDLARAVLALGFLFISAADELWIAYACTAALTLVSALFEGARNGAMPNVAGARGLLAANALMFSSRFLLMAVGSALGGAASDLFGYRVAFFVNALSFVVSAYSIWLIPEAETRSPEGAAALAAGHRRLLGGVWEDVRDGFRYVAGHRLVAALLVVNILWAVGGGALNLIYERVGSVVFAGQGGPEGDRGVAFVFTAVGAGLFLGMMLARRVGAHAELRGRVAGFIGWGIIAHGLLFALAGLMPTFWLATLMIFLSRLVVGVEFAVQDTLLLRLLPDNLRGRVVTTDRAAEIGVVSLSGLAAGWLLTGPLTPRSLTVLSGLLSAAPGLLWLLLFATKKLSLPARRQDDDEEERDAEQTALASAG